MAKKGSQMTYEEKMERFKRKPNSTPVKATKEYLNASLNEKNSDKQKAKKKELNIAATNTSNFTNQYDRNKTTTKVNNSNRNSHYNSSSAYNKINETVQKKNDHVQIDQKTFNNWMDTNRNRKTETNALDLGRQGTQREKQEPGDQKLMKMVGNIVGGMVNVPFKLYDTFKEATDENFDINDENNLSNLIDKQIEKNKETIYKDTNAVEQFAYQTLEGAGQFGAHALLAMATGGSSLVTMGLQAGTEKTYQNLQEGYDAKTAIGNGAMTGVMTSLIEKLPVDNFGKLVTSPLAQFSLAAIASQAISEGAEEGLEYLIEPQIDKFMLGKEVEYSMGELFMSVALGMSSGGLIGTVGNAVPIINSRKQFNQLKADMDTLIEYKNANQLTEEETVAIDGALTLAQKALNKFESTSVVGNAVQFESDKVNKLSAREIQENFTKFLQPQVDQDIKLNQEQQAVNSILETSQKVLSQKGIQMDALQYSKLDNDIKNEVDKIQSFANSLNTNVVFNSDLVTENGQVIDGMYIPEVGIVINPNGNRKAMSTFVHELTHGTESSQYYAPLKQLIIDSNGDYAQQVQSIKNAYKTVTDLSTEGATKEYVAIKTQDMLGNEQFVDKLVKYNTSLANRIFEGVKQIVSLTNTEQDIEYNFMKAFRNNGLKENGTNYETEELVVLDSKGDSVAPQFSLGTWTETNKEEVINDLVKRLNISEEKAKKWVNDVSGVAKIIANNKTLLDYEASPYHRSGWAGREYEALGITGYKDYTEFQKEYWIEPKIKNGKTETAPKENLYPMDYWDFTKTGKENAETYLRLCAEEGRKPKFHNFLVDNGDGSWSLQPDGSTDGYWKTLIDFKMYNNDGVGAPQLPVKPIFDDSVNKRILSEYDGSHRRKQANQSVVEEFLAEKFRNTVQYSIGLDSQGRTLTQEQQEYFKGSKVRDKNGQLMTVYHGTPNGEFTVFDADRIGETTDEGVYGEGFYFTDVKDGAQSYANGNNAKVYETYLNLTNPLRLDKLEEYNKLSMQRMDHEDILQQIGLTEEEFEAISESSEILEDNWQGYTIEELGFDGVIQGNDNGHIYVATNPNQIKNVTNTKPTSNKDIRYSIGLDPKNSSEKAIRNASTFIPNHEIIRSKYPEFDILNFNKAMLEQLSVGHVSEKTFEALKNDLIKNVYGDDFTKFNEATKQVDEFLDDSIKYFLTDAKYKSNKEYMEKISSRAIELLKAYNSLDKNKIESTYDAVEKQQQARNLIKKNKKERKVSIAQTVDTLVNYGNREHTSRFKTLEQVLDEVANGDVQLRSDLRDTLEMKRFEAQSVYIDTLNEYNELIKDVVKLGIKGGSKESKATQWFIEKHKEDGSPYELDQLLLEFDYVMPNGKKAYDNIQKAAKMISNAYEKLFEEINKNREDIYGDIDANNQIQTAELEAKLQEAHHKSTQIRDELRTNPSEKLQAIYYQQLEEERLLRKQVKARIARDESGDSTRRQKLQYRKNYAHHIVKQGFFSTLLGKFDGSSVREVPTYLAGISDDAEPKTGYAKFFSKQTGAPYEADAITGLAEYIKDAARIIAYDPYVDYLRDFADEIRATAEGDKDSDFTRYLTEYTNDIAGKTNFLDRGIRSMMGDKMFGIVKLINNRVKANAILGNVRTATTQIFNIPNALGVLVEHGGFNATDDIAKGSANYFKSILSGDGDNSLASPFIQSRYFDSDTGKTGITSTLEGLCNFMLSKGDELSTKMIWNIAYQQALRTNQENPIFYADDLTRRAVAGRGVGEVPVALQSQVMNLLIPFQVETNNAFRTLSSNVKNKNVAPVLTILLANWLFNGISEWLYKDRLLFDPLDVIIDGLNEFMNDDEKDEGKVILSTLKNLGGELGSSYPLTTQIIQLFGLSKDDTESVFGSNDPTRYGTGNVGLSVLGKAAKDVINGNYLDAASDLAANFALPGGGKQLQRTIEALQVNGMLPQFENGKIVKEPIYYTGSGKVGFVTNPEAIMDNPENFFDFAKQVMFGKWAGKEAQDYIDSGFKSMGKTQTNIFDALSEGMNKSDSYSLAEQVYEAKKNMTGEDGKSQFIEYLSSDDFTPEQRNEIYDTYYGDSAVTVRINEFAKGANLDADQTFKVKDILSTTVSLKDSSGESVRNSKALSIRKQLDELGLYDDVVKYINDNGLDYGDMGLNKTVGGMSNSEFQNKYKEIYGESYIAQTDDSLYNAYVNTFSGSISKGSKKTSNSKSMSNKTNDEKTFSLDVEKAKIDNILAKAYGGNTSTSNAYKKINNILNKVKSNKTSSKINVKTKYSKLIKDYLKNHPEDTYLFD